MPSFNQEIYIDFHCPQYPNRKPLSIIGSVNGNIGPDVLAEPLEVELTTFCSFYFDKATGTCKIDGQACPYDDQLNQKRSFELFETTGFPPEIKTMMDQGSVELDDPDKRYEAKREIIEALKVYLGDPKEEDYDDKLKQVAHLFMELGYRPRWIIKNILQQLL